jgi:hypothetical protein
MENKEAVASRLFVVTEEELHTIKRKYCRIQRSQRYADLLLS